MADCSPTALLEASKCFRCLPRGLLFSSRTDLLCQWANKTPVPSCSDADVDAWEARILADYPGAGPTPATKTAVCHFVQALKAESLWERLYYLNPVVYDAQTALDGTSGKNVVLYPLVVQGGGYLPASVLTGPAGDITLDGNGIQNLAESGIATGIIPSAAIFTTLPDLFGGLSYYESETGYTLPSIDCGCSCILNTETEFQMWTWSDLYFHGRFFNFSPQAAGAQVQVAAASDDAGFYSGSRQALNYQAMYSGVGGVFGILGSSNVDITPFVLPAPDVDVWFMTRNIDWDTPSDYTVRRYSLFAIHDPFSEDDTHAFYDIVQAFRQELGGGWV